MHPSFVSDKQQASRQPTRSCYPTHNPKRWKSGGLIGWEERERRREREKKSSTQVNAVNCTCFPAGRIQKPSFCINQPPPQKKIAENTWVVNIFYFLPFASSLLPRTWFQSEAPKPAVFRLTAAGGVDIHPLPRDRKGTLLVDNHLLEELCCIRPEVHLSTAFRLHPGCS